MAYPFFKSLHIFVRAEALAVFCGAALTSAAWAGDFDGRRAMASIEAQCGFGPRIPGTKPHRECRAWIKKQIEAVGLKVWEQNFRARIDLTSTHADAWNIWALPPGLHKSMEAEGDKNTSYLLVSAHWDTRAFTDHEVGTQRRQTNSGANDGASGVAVALEIARAIQGTPLEGRIILAFFDAEDGGLDGSNRGWCLGSLHAVSNLPPWYGRVRLGINLDMIAGRGLRLAREAYSDRAAPGAMDRLWDIGGALAPELFITDSIGPIIDDHYSFIQAGLPFIDLIGLPYPYWHKIGDDPDKCSAEVMDRLGTVLMEFLGRELIRKEVE